MRGFLYRSFCFCFFCFISLSLFLGGYSIADYRGDQFVIPGCKITSVRDSWATSDPQPYPLASNAPSGLKYGVYQACDDGSGMLKVMHQLRFSEDSIGAISLIGRVGGSLTGATHTDGVDGSFWVQNPKMDSLSGYTIEVCQSKSIIFHIIEGCKTLPVMKTFVSGLHLVPITPVILFVTTNKFGITNDGSEEKDDNGNGNGKTTMAIKVNDTQSETFTFELDMHKGGYVFTLYNNDCPYDQTILSSYDGRPVTDGSDTDACKKSSIIIGNNTAENNCRLAADHAFSGCPPLTECPCTENGSTVNQCDSLFMPKSNKNFTAPGGMNTTSCYICNSVGRSILRNCKRSIESSQKIRDVYNSLNPVMQQRFKSMYGQGMYLCAYRIADGIWGGNRLGCIKVPQLAPPRPFPRIARATPIGSSIDFSTHPAAHLFYVAPSVAPFRNNDSPTSCSPNPAELGEQYRGTFFRPKIKIQFGSSVNVITFTPKSAVMSSVYGPSIIPKSGIVTSQWNEDKPIRVVATSMDRVTCSISESGYQAFICTRLEYNADNDSESYVAYYSDNLSNQDILCDELDRMNLLTKIGSTPRPPLKFTSNLVGSIKLPKFPISMKTSDALDDATRYPVIVTINPKLVPLDPAMAEYHSGLSSLSVPITPTHLNPIASGSSAYVQGENCALIFLHKVCVSEDPCIGLDYIKLQDIKKPTFPTSLGLCDREDLTCIAYYSSRVQCQKQTYCDPDFLTTTACENGSAYAGLIGLDQPFVNYTTYNQWYPSVCITNGINYTPSDDDRRNYGDYGDKEIEYGITLSGVPNVILRLLRNFDRNNDKIFQNIVRVPINYFVKNDISVIIEYLKNETYQGRDSIASTYFGGYCDNNCIAKKVLVRPRTPREVGLCIDFTPASNTGAGDAKFEWTNPVDNTKPPSSSSGYEVQETYVPLRCKYLDLEVQGPGGGSTMFRSFLGSEMGCRAGRGPSGGIGSGIIEVADNNIDYLRLIRTTGSTVETEGSIYGGCGGSNNIGSWTAASTMLTSTDYHASAVFSLQDELAFGLGSYTNNHYFNTTRDCSVAASCGSVSSKLLTGSSYFGFGALCGITGTTNPGSSNGLYDNGSPNMHGEKNHCLGGTGWYRPAASRSNVFGAGGCYYAEVASIYNPLVYWDSRVNIQHGGWGGVFVRPSRVKTSDNINFSFSKDFKRDPKCLTTCPRIGILTSIGSVQAVCEYSGSFYNKVGRVFSTQKYASEIPWNAAGMPTHCVTKDGDIIIQSIDYGIQKCPEGTTMYTGNNKFYGLCVKNNTLYDAKKAIREDELPVISGAGTFCDPYIGDTSESSYCPAIRYWDAAASIQITTEIGSIPRYSRRCSSGGQWTHPPGGGNISPIKVLKFTNYSSGHSVQHVNRAFSSVIDRSVVIKCPTIDSEKIPYDPLYSMNAIWDWADSNTYVNMRRCKVGFIPYSSGQTMQRYCSYHGTWRGFTSNGDKPCLYTCPPIEDKDNNIRWDSPSGYSLTRVQPTCMTSDIPMYEDGVVSLRATSTSLPAGKTAVDFSRNCSMLSAANPVANAIVDSTTVGDMAPKWEDPPRGAKCIAVTYFGECIDDRNVCYNGGQDSEEVIGFCMKGTIYEVNSVKTTAPPRLVSGNTAEDFIGQYAYIYSNNITLTCSMSRPSSSSDMSNLAKSLPFSSVDTIAPSDPNFFCNVAKVESKLPVMSNNSSFAPFFDQYTNFDTDSFVNVHPDLMHSLEESIILDLPTSASDCVLQEGVVCDSSKPWIPCHPSASSPNVNAIVRQMSNSGTCSYICYDSTAYAMKFFTCTDQLDNVFVGNCSPVCSATPTTVYYSGRTGITKSRPSDMTGVYTMTAANTQSCIDFGLPNALIISRSSDPSIKERVGSYCNSVNFSVTGSPVKGRIKTKITNPIFDGRYDPNVKECWIPRGCSVLPIGKNLEHDSSMWILIADSSDTTIPAQRFTYGSFASPSGVCLSGKKYNASATNVFFVHVGCFDGTLLLLDMSQPFSHTTTTDCIATVPSVSNQLDYTINKNSSYISVKLGIAPIDLNKVPRDTVSRITYYSSLKSLQSNRLVS